MSRGRYMSEQQVEDLHRMAREGIGASEIARRLGRDLSGVARRRRQFIAEGGVVPARRKKAAPKAKKPAPAKGDDKGAAYDWKSPAMRADLIARRNAGKSWPQIAEDLGVSTRTLDGHVGRLGLREAKRQNRPHVDFTDPEVRALVVGMIDQAKSWVDIGKAVGLSAPVVQGHCRRNNIKGTIADTPSEVREILFKRGALPTNRGGVMPSRDWDCPKLREDIAARREAGQDSNTIAKWLRVQPQTMHQRARYLGFVPGVPSQAEINSGAALPPPVIAPRAIRPAPRGPAKPIPIEAGGLRLLVVNDPTGRQPVALPDDETPGAPPPLPDYLNRGDEPNEPRLNTLADHDASVTLTAPPLPVPPASPRGCLWPDGCQDRKAAPGVPYCADHMRRAYLPQRRPESDEPGYSGSTRTALRITTGGAWV